MSSRARIFRNCRTDKQADTLPGSPTPATTSSHPNLCNRRNLWIFFARASGLIVQMNYSNRHLRFGWWALAVYVCLGIVLETMHGFKIGWYLDVGNEVRRLMFTLGHFHGTMLALVNIAAGLTIRSVEGFKLRSFGFFCAHLGGDSLTGRFPARRILHL